MKNSHATDIFLFFMSCSPECESLNQRKHKSLMPYEVFGEIF